MNLDLPTPAIKEIIFFDAQDIFKPESLGFRASPIPGMMQPAPEVNIGEFDFFNKQMEIFWSLEELTKKVSFLSDELQGLKFIKLVLEENTTKTVISDLQGAVTTDLSATHTIRLFSLKEIYNGALKSGSIRRPLPHPNKIVSHEIAIYLEIDYEILKTVLDVSVLQEGGVGFENANFWYAQSNTKVIIEGGKIKDEFDPSLANAFIIDTSTLEFEKNQGEKAIIDVIASLNAEKIKKNNTQIGLDYISAPQIVKGHENYFSIINFIDREKLVLDKSRFRDIYKNFSDVERSEVNRFYSKIERITLELTGKDKSFKFLLPKSVGVPLFAPEDSGYISAAHRIKEKDLIRFDIPCDRLASEYDLRYYFEIKDGIRELLKGYGNSIRSDIGKLRGLLGEYTVRPSQKAYIHRHQDILPLSEEWIESHKPGPEPEPVTALKDLGLDTQVLLKMIKILFPESGTDKVAAFINEVTTTGISIKQKHVQMLLGVYEKVERFYTLNNIRIEPQYSDASKPSATTQGGASDILSVEYVVKNSITFNTNPKGYSFLRPSRKFLQLSKKELFDMIMEDNKKYLSPAVHTQISNMPLHLLGYVPASGPYATDDGEVLSPLAANGQTKMNIRENLYSYVTPADYIDSLGRRVKNSFVSEEDFFDFEKNLKRVVQVVADSDEMRTFLQSLEGISIPRETFSNRNIDKISNAGKKITEDLTEVESTGRITALGSAKPQHDAYTRLIAATLLEKYLPNPIDTQKHTEFMFFLLRQLEGFGYGSAAKKEFWQANLPNQLLLFAETSMWTNKGINKSLFRFSGANDPRLLLQDMDLNGLEDRRNYPFFFNNLFNLCRIEKLTHFHHGLVSSPRWKILEANDFDAAEPLLCRLVRPMSIPQSLRIPIYNEMFLLKGGY